MFDYLFALSILQIIWIDVLLSGDNAVVIALACQSLPEKKRRMGLIFGVALAVSARIAMAAVISFLLDIPFLKIVGGMLLLYIAVKVIKGEDETSATPKGSGSLWTAVGLIVIADITMSLDNVVAIAGASHGNDLVFILGLIISMPMMIIGASLISALIERFPIALWAGGGLLGWIAGGMIISDPYIVTLAPEGLKDPIHYISSVTGVALVWVVAWFFRMSNTARCLTRDGHA